MASTRLSASRIPELRRTIRKAPFHLAGIAALYFAGAVFSIHFSRFSGGIAMIWVSSAILAAALSVVRRRDRVPLVCACTLASFMATGLFGLGWVAALPLAIVNSAEAVIASAIGQRLFNACWPDESLEFVGGFYLGIGLVLPICTATLGAGIAMWSVGLPFEQNFFHWLLGHAVGLVTLLPFASAVARSIRFRERLVPVSKRSSALMMAVVTAFVALVVFSQPVRPLMLAPVVLTMFAAVWYSAAVAMALPVILAFVGGLLTLQGVGPMGQLAVDVGDRVQLFQLYVAITVICALPVAAEQEKRRRQLLHLRRSEAHLRELTGIASTHIAELSRSSMTDDLTGLPNRRAFVETLSSLCAQGRAASVAVIDIDHFKHVNDTHGRHAGDEVLRAFAALAYETLGSTDFLARIGGEEFGVIIVDACPDRAEEIAAKLIQRVADMQFRTAAGILHITMSTGLAPVGDSALRTLAGADRALRRAKIAGRSGLAIAA